MGQVVFLGLQPRGLMPFKNWKECTWKNVNDGKDNGLIKVMVYVG